MKKTLLILALLASQALAAEPSEPAAAGPQVAPEILREFRAIDELSAKAAYAEAAQKAEQLLPRLEDNPAGKALLLHTLATLYGLQRHYAHAASILEHCLAMHALPPGNGGKAQFELGQYYAGAENYPKAAGALNDWIKTTPDPKPEQLLLMADIHLRLDRRPEAISLVEKAVDSASNPKPEWRQFLLSLHHQAHDHQGCIRVLEALIEQFPDNPQYWNQLTGIYQEAGKEQHTLAVQQLMLKRGLLKTPGQILRLAQVMRFHRLHGRAAELLQAEIDKGSLETTAQNLELLANSWLEAKELKKAAATLEKRVALDNQTESLHKLGQIYSELHDWKKAENCLTRATRQGRLSNPGGAYLLLGLAQYRLNAKDKARAAFNKAQESPAIRKSAQQWLDYMEKEKGRSI